MPVADGQECERVGSQRKERSQTEKDLAGELTEGHRRIWIVNMHAANVSQDQQARTNVRCAMTDPTQVRSCKALAVSATREGRCQVGLGAARMGRKGQRA